MAKAPKPGSAGTTGGEEKAQEAQRAIKLTIRDESRTLRPGALNFQTRAIVRKATGLPLGQWLADMDEDSLRVIWWLAGRQEGDAFLTFDQVNADWPDDLTPDEFDLDRIDVAEDLGDPQP